MEERRQFTFDGVAEPYDLHRPGYPEELFDGLIALAGITPRDRILEVGCGTGQATRPMATRGFRILCLEPGENLARIARENLASFAGVEIQSTTFEEWTLESEAFSLMISAQAFHWLSEQVRFSKAARLLCPGGSLAVVGNSIDIERSPLLRELDKDYEQDAPSLLGPPPMNWYTESGPLASLFRESPDFERPSVARYPWSQTYTSQEYVSLLSTHSDHRLLPPSARDSLHQSIERRIDKAGGYIEIGYQANLYVARRAA